MYSLVSHIAVDGARVTMYRMKTARAATPAARYDGRKSSSAELVGATMVAMSDDGVTSGGAGRPRRRAGQHGNVGGGTGCGEPERPVHRVTRVPPCPSRSGWRGSPPDITLTVDGCGTVTIFLRPGSNAIHPTSWPAAARRWRPHPVAARCGP